MSLKHSLLNELLEICLRENISQSVAHQVLALYIQLCEVLKLWDVAYHYSMELRRFYLSARKHENSDVVCYVPTLSSEPVTIDKINQFQRSLKTNSIILAIMDRSSTVVYYEFTNGLVNPLSIDETHIKKQCDSQIDVLRKELNLYKKQLHAKAVSNSL